MSDLKVLKFIVRGEIQPYFPEDKRGNIWLLNMWYYSPTLKQVEKFLNVSWVNKRTYMDEVWECEHYGCELLADARESHLRGLGLQLLVNCRHYTRFLVEECKITKDEALPWSLYWVITNGHTLNIVRTRDKGFKLIEPQTDRIWTPDKNDQNLLLAIG